jgi:hypothetical protein
MRFRAARHAGAAAVAAAALAAVVALIGTARDTAPQAALTPTPQPSTSSGPELLYVANVNGPVTAYPVGSKGAASPVRSLAGPDDPNTFWGPWGVAFDAGGNAYVQSFLSDATTFVYPPGTSLAGRIFRVNGPDSRAVAVDAAGYAYVATGQAGAVISVAAPGASGVPGSLYAVPQVRQIPTDETAFHPWPGILTTDTSGHVIAAVVRSTGNAIEFFSAGPSGGTAPVRVIAGPHTGLGSCAAACDQLAVTYSPFTGRLYVAVSQGTQTHINVYADTASGDAAPVAVISGTATGLSGHAVTGIADSQRDGSIYALAKPTRSGDPATVLVFDRLANGNVAPLRSFTDAGTGLRDGLGIAIQ